MADVNGYLTSNRYTRYPFADDSTVDSMSEPAQLALFGCFVDAMVAVRRGYAGLKPVVSHIGLAQDGITLEFTLSLVRESSGATDIVHNLPLTCTRTSSDFITVYGKSDWCRYSFVLSSRGIRELTGHETELSSARLMLYLSPRCLAYNSDGVESISIYDGIQHSKSSEDPRRLGDIVAGILDPGSNPLPIDYVVHKATGNVALHPGYNLDMPEPRGMSTLVTTLNGSSESNSISLNAVPGAGLGQVPCDCDDELPKAPWLQSQDGHVRLFNDTCYDLVPSTKYGTLVMQAKCTACCTCDMYASVVNDRLVPLAEEIKRTKNKLDAACEQYESQVKRWNNRLNVLMPEDIDVTFACIPLDANATYVTGDGVAGQMDRCGFQMLVRNNSFIKVHIDIEGVKANGNINQLTLNYITGGNQSRTMISRHLPDGREYLDPFDLPAGRTASISYFITKGNMVQTASKGSGFSSIVILKVTGGNTTFTINKAAGTNYLLEAIL